MTLGLDLTTEEEFAVYAFLMRHFQQKKARSERELGIIKEINNRLYDKVYRYVSSCVGKKFNNYAPSSYSVDDYVNSAWEEIIQNFPKYNGTSKLTTFTKCYIDAGIRRQYESVCGNAYFRKKYARAQETDPEGLTANTCNALSIAAPDTIHNPIYDNIPTDSAEDVFIKELYNCYFDTVQTFKPYELYMFKLYSGDICGLYGRKYTLSMICADEELIRLSKEDGIMPVFGRLKRHQYSKINDKYIVINTPVEHLEVAWTRNKIKQLRKRFEFMA